MNRYPLLALILFGCTPQVPPIQPVQEPPGPQEQGLTVQEVAEKAHQGIVLTDAALAAADAFLPEGTAKQTLHAKRVKLEQARTVVEMAADDLEKVCAELPGLVELARGLQCPRCAAVMQSALDGGCKQP